MKWVTLTCGHSCWVPWIEAFRDRVVVCPGNGIAGGGSARALCIGKPHLIVSVYGQLEVVA